jgi:hypothetical protein
MEVRITPTQCRKTKTCQRKLEDKNPQPHHPKIKLSGILTENEASEPNDI